MVKDGDTASERMDVKFRILLIVLILVELGLSIMRV